MSNLEEPFLVAAVLSSTVPHRKELVAAVASAGGRALEAFAEPLIQVCLATNDREALAALLMPILGQRAGRYTPEQAAGFLQFVDLLARQGMSLEVLRGGDGSGDPLSAMLRNVPVMPIALEPMEGGR